MEFYAELDRSPAVPGQPAQPHRAVRRAGRQREKLIGRLEKSLGTTLATATRDDDPAMRQWEKTMIALGGTDVGDGGQYHVYGFQVMSDLMRHGTYDTGVPHRLRRRPWSPSRRRTPSDVSGGLQHEVVEQERPPLGTARHEPGPDSTTAPATTRAPTP